MVDGPYYDPERADRAYGRISAMVTADARRVAESWIVDAPDPDLALLNLERWLAAAGNPATHFAHWVEAGELGHLMAQLLGSSSHLADVLAQNPELGAMALEPGALDHPPSAELIEREGYRMLNSAHTYSFKLDRLRLLKQRSTLLIALADLGRYWTEEAVWAALSAVSEGIIRLCRTIVWEELVGGTDPLPPCPVSIVGFGKLGGHELNYSSDVDLAYVVDTDTSGERQELAQKFAERFGRAMADRMGRGALYRVDLRLRPFGSSGPLLNTLEALEAYYERYAEPWEHLALIRTLPIASDESFARRWDAMRETICFRPNRGEWAVEQILEDRRRTEEAFDLDDLKRGAGGIRDVEFLAQILQLVYGSDHPNVRGRPTCDVLRALAADRILDANAAAGLVEGYTFLRQLEHRCQIVGDRQTHTLPTGERQRTFLARTMGLSDSRALELKLGATRLAIRGRFDAQFTKPEAQESQTDPRESLLSLSDHPELLSRWLDDLPEAGAYYGWLASDDLASARAELLVAAAPRLIDGLRALPTLTEEILTGDFPERQSPPQGNVVALARWYRHEWLRACAQWTLGDEPDLGELLAELADQTIRCLCLSDRNLVPIVLGSAASKEMGVDSDIDLLFAVASREDHTAAERVAQDLLADVQVMRNEGAPFEVDLRLRPEGRKGMLVATLDGLRQYSEGTMESWERFALARNRPLVNVSLWAQEMHRAAYAHAREEDQFADLIAMKARIESERVSSSQNARHLKLGSGGLDDIDWLVQLLLFRDPPEKPISAQLRPRLEYLVDKTAIGATEAETLLRANVSFRSIRDRLALLGVKDGLFPEPGATLDTLSANFGARSGGDLQDSHGRLRQTVRSIYAEALERLKR